MSVSKSPLDARPARSDMTDREVSKIVCGLLGGMLGMADIDQIRKAVVWIADTPEVWDGFRSMEQMAKNS